MTRKIFAATLLLTITTSIFPLGVHAQATTELTLINQVRNFSKGEALFHDNEALANPGDRLDFYLSVDNTGGALAQDVVLNSEFLPDSASGTTVLQNPVNAYLSTSTTPLSFVPKTPMAIGAIPVGEYADIQKYSIELAKETKVPVIEHMLTATLSNGNSVQKGVKIFVDVKPHVREAYFSPSAVKGNGVDTTTLFVKVQDKNGCENIDTVSATLNTLLPSEGASTPLTQVSCDNATGTALYQKTGIQVSAAQVNKTFQIPVSVTDKDGFVHDPQDTFFSKDDAKEAFLMVTEDSAPIIRITEARSNIGVQTAPYQIGGRTTELNVKWTVDKPEGEYYVRYAKEEADQNFLCTSGGPVTNIPQGINLTGSGTSVTTKLLPTSFPEDGQYFVRICFRPTLGNPAVGSTTFQIERKEEEAKLFVELHQDAIQDDPNTYFDMVWYGGTGGGTYDIFVNDQLPRYSGNQNVRGIYLGDRVQTRIHALDFGQVDNIVRIAFQDELGNPSETTVRVTKVGRPLGVSNIQFLPDTDQNPGVDIRDINATWNAINDPQNTFHAYRIFAVPAGTTIAPQSFFDGKTLEPVAIDLIKGTGVKQFNGVNSVSAVTGEVRRTDSLGNPFVHGQNYTLYVQVESISRGLSDPVQSNNDVVLNLDQEPAPVEVVRTSSTQVEASFSTIVTSVDVSKLEGALQNATLARIENNRVFFTTVPTTETDTIAPAKFGTGAVVTQNGAANSQEYTVQVKDKMVPVVSLHNPITASGTVIGGQIRVEYEFSEEMDPSTLALHFTQSVHTLTGDNNAPHTVILPLTQYGKKTRYEVTLLTDDLRKDGALTTDDRLKHGGFYDVRVVGKDRAGNTGMSEVKEISVDTQGPAAPILEEVNGTGMTFTNRPTLSWQPANDGQGGSGIATYVVEIARREVVGGTLGDPIVYAQFSNITPALAGNTSFTLPLTDVLPTVGKYAFRVTAYDKVSNSTTSAYKDFSYTTETPVITGVTFENITRPGSGNVARTGDVYRVVATITESSGSLVKERIFASLNGLTTAMSGQQNPGTYENGVARWDATITVSGNTTVPVLTTIKNPEGVVTATGAQLNIAIDNQAPVLDSDVVRVLEGRSQSLAFQPGDTLRIRWDVTKIHEANYGPNPIRLVLKDDTGTFETVITEGVANSGQLDWTIPLTTNESERYRIVLTVRDSVGFTTETQTVENLIIDGTPPSGYPQITFPSASGVIVTGGSTLTVLWSGAYQDLLSPRTENRFVLEYSTDNGANWTGFGTANDTPGSFTWTVPSVNTDQALVRIVSFDKAENHSEDQSDFAFKIDQEAPRIESVVTRDRDQNGKIDLLEITYSEPVKESSLSVANYDVLGIAGETLTAVDATDLPDDRRVGIAFTEGANPDTEVRPSLTYTRGTTTDMIGIFAETQGPIVAGDGATPVLLSGAVFDNNGNGYSDTVEAYFSEPVVNVGTLTWVLNNIPSGGTLTGVQSTGNRVITLTLTEGSGPRDTSKGTLTINYAGGEQDLAGNTAGAKTLQNADITDRAAPLMTTALLDETTSAYGALPTQVQVVFSEPMIAHTFTTGEWQVGGQTPTSLRMLGNNVILQMNGNTTDTSINGLPVVNYTGSTALNDVANNPMTLLFGIRRDGVGPRVETIEIRDRNGNGAIDEILMRVTEPLTAPQGVVNVNGGPQTIVRDVNNGQIWTIALTQEIPGTGAPLPEVSFIAGALTDSDGNLSHALLTQETVEQDLAGPALVGAYLIPGATGRMVLQFSEAIADNTLTTPQALLAVTGGGTITNALFDNTDTPNDEQVVVLLSPTDTVLAPGTTQLALAQAGILQDRATTPNSSTGVLPVTLLGSLVINEMHWGEGPDYWVELHNLSDQTITFNSTTNSYALYKGIDRIALIDEGTIPPLGYMILAARPKEQSALSDTAFIEGISYLTVPSLDLSPTGGMSYALHQGPTNTGVLMDRAEDGVDGVYFAGTTGTTVSSMERRSPLGAGNLPGSWQTSVNTIGNFDTITPTRRGTPGMMNAGDITGPTIADGVQTVNDSRTPEGLVPQGAVTVRAEYADNAGGSGIDVTPVTGVTLYVDTNHNGVFEPTEEVSAQANITDTSITYTPTVPFTSGEIAVRLIVRDRAGISTQTDWSFWVDALSVNITHPNVLFSLPGGAQASSREPGETTVIEITTYGAGVNLTGILDTLLSTGTIQIPDYTQGPERGFGYEVSTLLGNATDPVTLPPSSGTFNGYGTIGAKTNLVGGVIAPQTLSTGMALRKYTIAVRYRLAVPQGQPADVYRTNLALIPDFVY